MRTDKTAPTAQPAESDAEHRLVTELREAIERKDLVTMGRMLELLSSIRSELVMGRPVIDALASQPAEPPAGGAAAAKTRPTGPVSPVSRSSR